MDPARLEKVSKLLSNRRLSRRKATRHGVGTLATTGLAHATAAEDVRSGTPSATREAVADPEKTSFLFVQTFGAGSITYDEDGNLSLAADPLTGQTIYFSDRPERRAVDNATRTFPGIVNSQTARRRRRGRSERGRSSV